MYNIDWEDLRKGYNRIYRKKYGSVKTMLECELSGPGSMKQWVMAEKLGVSAKSLSNKLLELGLRKLRKMEISKENQLIALHKNGELAQLKALDVCRKLGISVAYFYNLVHKHRLKYLKKI